MGKIRLSTQALESSLVNSNIADNAVDGRVIVANAIVGSHVSANAIVSSHVSANAIVGSHVSAGAIVGSHVAASSIVNSHIADGTIAASKLAFAVAQMVWNELPTGTINSTNQIFTIATAPTGYNIMPFLNGVVLQRVDAASDNTGINNYFMASTGAVLFTIGVAPTAGDSLYVTYAI